MLPLGVVIVYLCSVAVYFIPAIVAAWRGHHNTAAIVVLNLFLGWTVLGWVFALVWACTKVQIRGPSRAEIPPAWSAEQDEMQWSAHARGERTPSRW
jgi:hypothetical protein